MAKKWPEMVVTWSSIKGHSFPITLYLSFYISFPVLASPVSSSTSSSLSSPGSNASPTTTTKVEQGSLVQVKTEISNDLEQQKPQPQQQVITINGQQVMVSFYFLTNNVLTCSSYP